MQRARSRQRLGGRGETLARLARDAGDAKAVLGQPRGDRQTEAAARAGDENIIHRSHPWRASLPPSVIGSSATKVSDVGAL